MKTELIKSSLTNEVKVKVFNPSDPASELEI